jgi:hypothetical protein
MQLSSSPVSGTMAVLLALTRSSAASMADTPPSMEFFLSANSISVVYTNATIPTSTVHGALATASSQATPALDSVRKLCPADCSDAGTDPGNWSVYHTIYRVAKCNETMLLDLSVYNALNDADNHITIRSCSSSFELSQNESMDSLNGTCSFVPHPQQITNSSQLAWFGSPSSAESTQDVVQAAQQVQAYLENEGTACNQTIQFAYSGQAAIGLYAGSEMQGQGVAPTFLS